MIDGSALYAGRVVHARLKPKQHKLSYACYWLLLDLDEIEGLSRKLRMFSLDRFNLFSLRTRDYGDGSGADLRTQARAHLDAAGIDLADGKIFLLTMPRIFGYGFNPLSVYFCQRSDGTLAAMIYEVHNTFGQRHSYLIPVADGAAPEIVQTCAKQFYVSPFMEMNLRYDFRVLPPAAKTFVSVKVSDQAGLMLSASLAGEKRPLSNTSLARIFVTHPLLTAKVIGAIHWEALRLWLKGVGLVPRPAPPQQTVTIANSTKPVG
jgi:DUF1365 family protein